MQRVGADVVLPQARLVAVESRLLRVHMEWSKLKRLWQPTHRLFWVMLGLNAASSGIFWIVQTHGSQLTDVARIVLAGLALGNLYWGLKCARELIRG